MFAHEIKGAGKACPRREGPSQEGEASGGDFPWKTARARSQMRLKRGVGASADSSPGSLKPYGPATQPSNVDLFQKSQNARVFWAWILIPVTLSFIHPLSQSFIYSLHKHFFVF